MYKYLLPVLLAVAGYVWYSQMQINSLKTELALEQKQVLSLRGNVIAERNVNKFIYDLNAKKTIEQLERKDLSYDEFKSKYDDWVVKFNSV